MLIDVETFLLNTGVNTETDSLLDAPEEHDTAGGSPCVDAENAEALCAEEAEAVAIESASVNGKQTGQECTEDTADAMHGTGTDGVVNVKLLIDEFNCERQYDTTDGADEDSAQGRYEVTAGGDAHQSGQHAVEHE